MLSEYEMGIQLFSDNKLYPMDGRKSRNAPLH
jgi:hypothetical protein